MRKSTLIATCLVNSNIITRLEDAERSVAQVFADEFPKAKYLEWNTNINDKTAKDMIEAIGRASRINVEKFIEDLW